MIGEYIKELYRECLCLDSYYFYHGCMAYREWRFDNGIVPSYGGYTLWLIQKLKENVNDR